MSKGLLAWIPYVVVVGMLYFLGRIDFQIHHPIVFLLVMLVAAPLLVTVVLIWTRPEK